MRILVADDHAVVRAGVRGLLAERPEWEVCGEAATGREAVAKAVQFRPDLVIMDMSMPDGDGLEATRQVREQVPECEVLVLSVYESEKFVRDVVAAGAKGYLSKTDTGQNLIQAVEAVGRHEPFFSSRIAYLLTQPPQIPAEELTPREREIVRLVAAGRTSNEIAKILRISKMTVETHRSRVMQKAELGSVAELVRYAIREKLLEP